MESIRCKIFESFAKESFGYKKCIVESIFPFSSQEFDDSGDYINYFLIYYINNTYSINNIRSSIMNTIIYIKLNKIVKNIRISAGKIMG